MSISAAQLYFNFADSPLQGEHHLEGSQLALFDQIYFFVQLGCLFLGVVDFLVDFHLELLQLAHEPVAGVFSPFL